MKVPCQATPNAQDDYRLSPLTTPRTRIIVFRISPAMVLGKPWIMKNRFTYKHFRNLYKKTMSALWWCWLTADVVAQNHEFNRWQWMNDCTMMKRPPWYQLMILFFFASSRFVRPPPHHRHKQIRGPHPSPICKSSHRVCWLARHDGGVRQNNNTASTLQTTQHIAIDSGRGFVDS